MTAVAYTYCLVRYVHDPAAGERLNIGVLLYAPEARHPNRPFLGVRIERRYERLSKIFSDFDGDHYRRTLNQFETAVERLREHLTGGLYAMWDRPQNAGGVGTLVWPDSDLSFQIGPVLAGVAPDPAQALEAIYRRMVTSQHERPENIRRSDDDVWAVYQQPLYQESVGRLLKPKTFETDLIELEFQHTFRNGHYRALLPVSMDYVRVENIRDKAARWLGNAMALKDNPDLAKLYILLGPPHLESHQRAYVRAKNLLHQMPIAHEFVEEEEAEAFASSLSAYMREHGVLPKETVIPDLASTEAVKK